MKNSPAIIIGEGAFKDRWKQDDRRKLDIHEYAIYEISPLAGPDPETGLTGLRSYWCFRIALEAYGKLQFRTFLFDEHPVHIFRDDYHEHILVQAPGITVPDEKVYEFAERFQR